MEIGLLVNIFFKLHRKVTSVWFNEYLRLFTPHSIITETETIYLNVNLSHELWKDVNIKILRIFDNKEWYLTIPFGNTVWNLGNYLLGY